MQNYPLRSIVWVVIAVAMAGCTREEIKPANLPIDSVADSFDARVRSLPQAANELKKEASAPNSTSAPKPVESDSASVERNAYAADVEERIKKIRGESGKWRYSEDIEKMNGKMSKFAFITSENSFDFAFPYAGENYGGLMIRQRSSDGLSVMFSVSKGQIICIPSCSIRARFDDRPPITFNGVLPSDYSSNKVFLQPAAKFVAELRKSKRVLVEATYHAAGSQVSEFITEGFQWQGKSTK